MQSSKSQTIDLSEEQEQFCSLLASGQNVFLTGKAGTGKSTALVAAVAGSHQAMVVTGTTGIAALNLQAQFRDRLGIPIPAYTIYRWAGIRLGPAAGQSNEQYYDFLRDQMGWSNTVKKIRAATVVVIDEISMLPGRVLDYLHYHCCRIRDDYRPFGGLQIVAVGDFLQLPPVAKIGKYDWAFQHSAWESAGFANCYLQQVWRQTEGEFVAALNGFRVGDISPETVRFLAGRVQRFVSRDIPRLMTHNSQVDKWNNYQLEDLDGEEQVFLATFEGKESECEFLRKNSITPDILRLKVRARVMVTQNLPDGEAVNGQLGFVRGLGEDTIVVDLDDCGAVIVYRKTISFDPQNPNSSTMTQFPLRLAYGMTIHKSQGLSLDQAHLDIRAAHEPGQAYVALSRLRGVAGLTLKDGVNGVFVSRDAIKFYENL